MKKVNKQFVSEIDKKLDEFNKTHPKSPSQQSEIDKYKIIHQLRDVSEKKES